MNPLESGWRDLSGELRKSNTVEREMMRRAFYQGAKCAIAATRGPLSLTLMRAEVRTFEAECADASS